MQKCYPPLIWKKHAALLAQDTDTKTKFNVPRTSTIPVHSVTQSEVLKSGITDENIDTSKETTTEAVQKH